MCPMFYRYARPPCFVSLVPDVHVYQLHPEKTAVITPDLIYILHFLVELGPLEDVPILQQSVTLIQLC